MCTGIYLSPNKWTSITCGPVFSLSSFSKSALSFPWETILLILFCAWEWLALSAVRSTIAPPLSHCFREGHTIQAEPVSSEEISSGIRGKKGFLSITIFGHVRLGAATAIYHQEGDQLEAEGDSWQRQSWEMQRNDVWILLFEPLDKTQTEPISILGVFTYLSQQPKVIPLRSSSQKLANNEWMLT